MSKRLRVATWSAALLSLLLSTAGCGGGSFVGRRFDNFTAYYNTFYNARKSFQQGVKALEQTTAPVDRRYYISVFTAPGRATNTQTFQNAIDKSADVLRDHPNSKWVDDALMLIGQSYFYQENYVGAEQKFREVIDLGSGLEDEARLWLARTLIAAGAYNEARDHLVVSLSQDDLSDRWAPELHLALGQLYVHQKAFAEAAEQLRLGLEAVRDNELEARGWFLLGQVYEQLEQYEEAVAAFERVRHTHPRYELSYAADVSAIRIRGVHLDAEPALRDLRRMERDDKNYTNRFELAYLRALIYQAQGRAGQAQQLYHEILYDPNAQINDLRGRIHYALGKFYEEIRVDFIKAAAHYDTARTGLSGRTPTTQQQLQFAPEAITDVDQRASTFATFATAHENLARMDSLLELGSLDPEAFAERILEIRREMAAEMARQQRMVERRQAERGFQNAAAMAGEEFTPTDNQDTGTAGFLFHRDPIRVQENRLSFIDRWGERPHVPNWRRMEAVFAAQAAHNQSGDAVSDEMADLNAGVGQAVLPQLDYSAVPRDSISRARMRADRALARYNLGNVLFLSMNMPDSAAAWYRLVITEDADEEVAQRAYYALAEVQRSLGDTAAARRIYEQVLRDYPDSDFAGRVREQLGIREEVPSDSVALAVADYESAYTRWRRGYHHDALNRMITVAARHRRTEVAPKALLAAARIYLEWANEDSLDIFGPLPISVSDSLIALAGLYDVSYGVAKDLAAGTDAGEPGAADSAAPDSALGATGPSVKEIMAAEVDAARDVADPRPRRRVDPNGDVLPEQVPEGAVPGSVDSSAIRDVAVPDLGQDSLATDAGTAADSLATFTGETADSLSNVAGDTADSLATVTGVAANFTINPSSILVDSLAVLTGVSADSLASWVGIPADSLETRVGMSVDSLAMLAGVPADSILTLLGPRAALETGGTRAIQPIEDDAVYLRTLYASVRQNYPSTPYAGQAERMLEVLAAREHESKPDEPTTPIDLVAEHADSSLVWSADSSLAVSADSNDIWSVDSLAVESADADVWVADSSVTPISDAAIAMREDSLTQGASGSAAAAVSDSSLTAALDSTDGTPSSDSTSAADGSVAAADTVVQQGNADPSQQAAVAIPTGEAAMKGEGIRQELGGYTLMIGMHLRRPPMEALAAKYAEAGFRTAVITEKVGSTELYRAVVGQFTTLREAGQAMMQYESEFDEQLQVTSLTDPSSSTTGMR